TTLFRSQADGGAGARPGAAGTRCPVGYETAVELHGPLDFRVDARARRRGRHVDRFIAVLADDALDLTGQNVQGFVPRNADPLVPAAKLLPPASRFPVLPLEGILQPVRAQNPVALGPALGTAAERSEEHTSELQSR